MALDVAPLETRGPSVKRILRQAFEEHEDRVLFDRKCLDSNADLLGERRKRLCDIYPNLSGIASHRCHFGTTPSGNGSRTFHAYSSAPPGGYTGTKPQGPQGLPLDSESKCRCHRRANLSRSNGRCHFHYFPAGSTRSHLVGPPAPAGWAFGWRAVAPQEARPVAAPGAGPRHRRDPRAQLVSPRVAGQAGAPGPRQGGGARADQQVRAIRSECPGVQGEVLRPGYRPPNVGGNPRGPGHRRRSPDLRSRSP